MAPLCPSLNPTRTHTRSLLSLQGSVKELLDDVKELRPTLFIAVPRVLERICDGVKQKMKQATPIARTLLSIATQYKLWRLKRGAPNWYGGQGGVGTLGWGKAPQRAELWMDGVWTI